MTDFDKLMLRYYRQLAKKLGDNYETLARKAREQGAPKWAMELDKTDDNQTAH